MNTTEDFIRNFNSDDITSVVTKFFDEIMVLYNLVGNRQDVDICTDNSSSLATFILLMDNKEDAEKLYNDLNGMDFTVYGSTYLISMTLSKDSSITTVIYKVTKE